MSRRGKLLLHVCCAPCTIGVLEPLRRAGWQVTALWYNPNIHPGSEYRRREKTFLDFAPTVELSVIRPFDYDIIEYLRQVAYREQDRCMFCYRLRLGRTARLAAKGGYDAFASTLMLSPYQDHELLCKMGESAGRDNEIRFFYEDFRDCFQSSLQSALESGLYLQKYCGCIYSEVGI